MNVESARHGPDALHLLIDGYAVTAGEKYTIVELGYAVLIADEESGHAWLAEIGETIPPDPEDSRGPLRGSEGWAVTSDPVVVALSSADWWARKSDEFEAGRLPPIPTRDDAVQVVRSRRILNDFNQKYAGKLPSDWR